ncbi:sugar O-acetyltransferase [Gloeobacter morelensis]|uniref:Sugar O-acetyltransferase n=1 Tax=Gloeobacter morelensis MG652769 TaxID=2781736 RepID=A0ABY3PRT9_9CYAN|nr:sugar O-acetyltransferase [Gloeobacter morelensis]UFP96239.1 sugar O-acetyltransferase [Gloeobacter morelensis MG652769]
MMRSEKQKMLAGELYRASAPELVALRVRARGLVDLYNATAATQGEQRRLLLSELFGSLGQSVEIESPFFCDYGSQIHVGEGFYLNTGCVILDCAAVTIGAHVLIAPGVHIYTATHPTDPAVRRSGLELALPVTIGDNVWIGGGAIVCPGVTIGENTTIGAGSVVVKSIPANVIAAGNPCRVLRPVP